MRRGDYLFPIVFFFGLAGLLYVVGLLLGGYKIDQTKRLHKVGHGLISTSKIIFYLGLAVGVFAYYW
jgi:NhaP-type Na+/H+ and K+/H+ antiporter